MQAINKRSLAVVPVLLLLLLSILALLRMAYRIISHTSNSLGTDYDFIVPAVVTFIDPSTNLIDHIKACCFGPHCFLQQISLHALIASLCDWDSHAELLLGLLLAVLRLPLMIATLSTGKPLCKIVGTAIIIALTFGTTSTSSFICGQPSLSTGVVLFWFCLASYCANSYSQPAWHGLWYFVSGLFAGITGAYLLLPIGIVGALSAWVKKSKTLLTVTVITGLAGGLILLWVKSLSKQAGDTIAFALRPDIFIQILGRPFYDHLGVEATSNPYCALIALVGLLALAIVLFLRLKHAKTNLPTGAYSYVIFGLAMSFLISCTRSSIAPWYAPFALFFWLGLSAMAFELYSTVTNRAARAAAIAVLAAISLFYLSSNISFKDKDFYQHTHGPVSESVLRNYKIAPTYGESYISASHIGTDSYRLKIAAPLNQHNWSAFAPRQRWDLQGDFYLPTVTVAPPNNYRWVNDSKSLKAREWKVAEKLNLLLLPDTTIDWQIKLPDETIEAAFLSETLATATNNQINRIKVQVRLNNRALAVFNYSCRDNKNHPLKVDLSPFRGQSINLQISTAGATSAILLKQPHIDLLKQRALANTPDNNFIPCNMELSPYFAGPASKELVLTFSNSYWQTTGLKLTGTKNEIAASFDQPGACLSYKSRMQVPVKALKEIVFGIAADTSLEYQDCVMQFTTDKNRVVTEHIPVLKDSNWHQYSLAIKATKLEPDETIVGMTFFPYFMQDHANFKLGQFKLRYQ